MDTLVYFANKIVYFLSFNQAYHENFVHSYQITFQNNHVNKTYLYFSDFFLLKEDRKERITFKLSSNLKEGNYNVTIMAIESYGKKSLPCQKEITLIK